MPSQTFSSRPPTFLLEEDILHVRLQTLGVKEHSFEVGMGGIQYTWSLYDVGGAVRIASRSK